MTDISMWIEDDITYLKINGRSGLFQIRLDDETSADFLADIEKTGNQKNYTIYSFVGISNPKIIAVNDKKERELGDE